MDPKIQADLENAEDGAIDMKKLSAGQKKKLKEKAKKEPDAKAAAERAAKGEAPAEEEKKAPAKGKAKKGNAMAELAKEKQRLLAEAQAEADAINAKAEEEARMKQEAEDAEAARVKAIDDAKKQEKRDHIQALKDKGEWMTKKQLAKKKAQDAKRADLIAQGIIKEGDENEEEQPKKSQIVKNRKTKKDKQQQQEKSEAVAEDQQQEKQEEKAPVEKKVEKVAASVKKDESSEDDAVDDWENADLDEIADKIKDKDISAAIVPDDEDKIEVLEAKEAEIPKNKKNANAPGAGKKGKKGDTKEDGGPSLFDGEENDMTKEERMKQRKEENMKRLKERNERNKNKQQKMRCPIVCILGHVDTGKTLILDKLRKTNVQAGEAGGITQQIGATYFPKDYIEGHIKKMNGRMEFDLQLPGYLVIDTPGHESFTNLRSRGSSLCDIAILVVDLMHGLEQQTLESIELLRQKKCPFIIALNKIDRCYEWKSEQYRNFRDSLEVQKDHTLNEFQDRLQKAVIAFAEQGFNACLYYENSDINEFHSFVPTSAITGEGLPDLMTYLSYMCQTKIPKQLYERDEHECTVLEVKVIEGLGTTIDVVLVNGLLKVQDTIVLQGFNGPIVTQIRALLTPHPMKEMRVKAEYIHHQKIKGAMGIKISAPGLENAIAGSELYVAKNDSEIHAAQEEIKSSLYDILDKYVDKTQDGVCVQASTLGSMEALLEFLLSSKIPVCSISIGPVHKKDVMKAMKVLALDESKIKKEFATILAFDVRVTPEAANFAEQEGIKIFTANIIYHLFDEFTAYVKMCQDARKDGGSHNAIFPCALEVVKDAVFNRGNPIIIGVNVTAGCLRLGTPLCIPEKENLRIGVVESIELNKKSVNKAYPKDGSVAVRIGGQQHVNFGRHFDETNQICSWMTRKSIDTLKDFFRDEMTMDDWKLVKALKAKYKIE